MIFSPHVLYLKPQGSDSKTLFSQTGRTAAEHWDQGQLWHRNRDPWHLPELPMVEPMAKWRLVCTGEKRLWFPQVPMWVLVIDMFCIERKHSRVLKMQLYVSSCVHVEYWCFYTYLILLCSRSGVFFTLSKPPWVQGFGVRPGFSFVTDPVSQQLMILFVFFFQGTTLEMTL